MDNKSLSQSRWKCQYHIVFIPKIPKEGIVWENTQRCPRDNRNFMPV